MLNGKKITVVMPAFNAERTLRRTYSEIPRDIVDDILLVDDKSADNTVLLAKSMGIRVHVHENNIGYGGNQKTCYREAVRSGADIVVMLHPDYQYPPKLITAMAALIASDSFDVVLGSRILGNKAIKGGMPVYKYIANRALTFFENLVIREKLSEYHTGFRAFSRKVLTDLPIMENSDDFIFDNEMLLQSLFFGYRVGEITCPASYTKDSSSIGFARSVIYGSGVIANSLKYALAKSGITKIRIFDKRGRKIV